LSNVLLLVDFVVFIGRA